MHWGGVHPDWKRARCGLTRGASGESVLQKNRQCLRPCPLAKHSPAPSLTQVRQTDQGPVPGSGVEDGDDRKVSPPDPLVLLCEVDDLCVRDRGVFKEKRGRSRRKGIENEHPSRQNCRALRSARDPGNRAAVAPKSSSSSLATRIPPSCTHPVPDGDAEDDRKEPADDVQGL